MAKRTIKKPQEPKLTDSESSDEDNIPQYLKTTKEERHYGTVPESAVATIAASSFTRAQCNPTVERGPERKVRTKVKKLPKDKASDQETQTSKTDTDK